MRRAPLPPKLSVERPLVEEHRVERARETIACTIIMLGAAGQLDPFKCLRSL
jgi:hypothetical protein